MTMVKQALLADRKSTAYYKTSEWSQQGLKKATLFDKSNEAFF
jgi:hypothetical protein